MQDDYSAAERDLKRLSQSLGVPYEPQDWGIVNADGQRLSEFIIYYESVRLSATQRFELAELILASANERLLSGKSLPEELLPFLTRNWQVVHTHVAYWRDLQNEPEFPLAHWVRCMLPEGSYQGNK